jgi:SAM-dependent methyltransferase
LRNLAAELHRQARQRLGDPGGVDIVDVGCGTRPYEPLFRPFTSSYVGVDVEPGPTVDVVAPAEALPFEDESFDCALCTQVLEHVSDPSLVCAELRRVLRPGGVALVSTHGVARYHAASESGVEDYWRWTHAGLAKVLKDAAEWSDIQVLPNGGTGAALAYLIGRECDIVAAKLRVRIVGAAGVFAINVVASTIDGAQRRFFPDRLPGLAPNYLAVAVR